jgi:DNA-binding transcriptional ArsR family regulator
MQRCTHDIDIVPLEDAKATRIAELLKVFADPGRIQILSVLVDKEVCVSHIAQAIGKSVSAVSHQLSIMRSHNIVRYVRDGKNTYYTLDDKHVENVLKSGIEHIDHID